MTYTSDSDYNKMFKELMMKAVEEDVVKAILNGTASVEDSDLSLTITEYIQRYVDTALKPEIDINDLES